MSHHLHLRRLALIVAIMLGVFAGLTARLVYLQSFKEDELTRIAQDNTRREVLLEPRRGEILDARGELLATSQFVKKVCADASLIGNQQAPIARALAPLLELPPEKLYQLLQATRRVPKLVPAAPGSSLLVTQYLTLPDKYVELKSKVPIETWQKVEQTMTNLNFGYDEKTLTSKQREFLNRIRRKAIFPDVQSDQIRTYPQGRLAAHVLGYTASRDQIFATKDVRDLTGVDGIERQYDKDLSGQRGWRLTEVDKSSREVVDKRAQDVEAKDGLNVVLTLDSFIQHEVENALADAVRQHSPISAACVVVRPKTGDILALSVLPDFDPNSPGRPGTATEDRKNRLIADIHEPGSTFKVAVVSGALDKGIVTLGRSFFCENGRWLYGGRLLHDDHPAGTLTVEGIITKSSNIGAAKVGLELGPLNLWNYIRAFGFGSRTGVELPGEVFGIVHNITNWSGISITRIPMGHEVAVTPLQMVMAMSAIANDGVLMRPRLVDRLQDREGRVVTRTEPREVRRVIGSAAARDMVRALKTVVGKGGTAEKAAMACHTVAGKTGTAQKAGPGGYLHGKYFSSFIGFFPADNPEVCIGIFLDEPKEGYYGGQVAAPVFRQMGENIARYLNIPPDRPVPAEKQPSTDHARRVPNLAQSARNGE